MTSEDTIAASMTSGIRTFSRQKFVQKSHEIAIDREQLKSNYYVSCTWYKSLVKTYITSQFRWSWAINFCGIFWIPCLTNSKWNDKIDNQSDAIHIGDVFPAFLNQLFGQCFSQKWFEFVPFRCFPFLILPHSKLWGSLGPFFGGKIQQWFWPYV